MNTSRPTPFGPAIPGLVHSSTRTALSANVDPATGEITRVLSTSRLEIAWQGKELVIRSSVAQAVLGNEERTRRWNREER